MALAGAKAAMSVSGAIRREVETRAGDRCEYCGMHQSLQGAQFHVEHILPISSGGTSELQNLALACPGCNLRKSDRVVVFDDQTGTNVPLFNPRIDLWAEHFQWSGYALIAQTSMGRATIAALELNHSRRIKIRHAEKWFGLFPPLATDQ
jgi:hypothetical protein